MWVSVFVRHLRFSAEKRERREESYDLKSVVALFNECVENLKKDSEYDFKPLEVFVPDPAYKVDEKELEKSIEKNRAIIARTRENRKRHLQNGKIST